jgi:hypothetical protein
MRPDTMAMLLSQLFNTFFNAEETDNALKRMGYAKDQDGFRKFKFVRDYRVSGLFDVYDEQLTESNHLRCLIHNAQYNEDERMRNFCDYVIRQKEMCETNITDDDVIEYLLWLARHTPSPRSTFAATSLYHLINVEGNLTADQMQFVRENPHLALKRV